eukprot:6183271-Pleurochrysis_carterae.AAC.3
MPLHERLPALYSPDFYTVVSGDEGGLVCTWDVNTGERRARARLNGHVVARSAVSYSHSVFSTHQRAEQVAILVAR